MANFEYQYRVRYETYFLMVKEIKGSHIAEELFLG